MKILFINPGNKCMMPADNAPAATPEEFLAQLKEQTARLHRQLEESPLSMRLMSPEVGLQHYAHYLAAMRGVIDFTESKIAPLLASEISDLNERIKLPAIDRDLSALSKYVSIPAYPAYAPFPFPVSPAFAMGVMYVIEGSTLGGRVILKHLLQRPFSSVLSSDEGGTAFFTGYGEQTGRLWKSFLLMLSGYAMASSNPHEIIEGARHTFRSIHEHFMGATGAG